MKKNPESDKTWIPDSFFVSAAYFVLNLEMASPSRSARLVSCAEASSREVRASDCLSVTVATEVIEASVSSSIAEMFSMDFNVVEPEASMSFELF